MEEVLDIYKKPGSVSKVEMVTPMALIYKVLFSSISTFETLPKYVWMKGRPNCLGKSVLLSPLSLASHCSMTPSIREMGQQTFSSLLHHEWVNDIRKSPRSEPKWIGRILSENLLINIILMWKKFVW